MFCLVKVLKILNDNFLGNCKYLIFLVEISEKKIHFIVEGHKHFSDQSKLCVFEATVKLGYNKQQILIESTMFAFLVVNQLI